MQSNPAVATFGPFTIGSSTANNTLPVSLLSFNAQQQTNTIALQWETTNEINSSHFNIQRSIDGVNFIAIGAVTSKGGGNYEYIDNLSTISQQPATVYYRLQMVDKDGSFTFSKAVAVSLTKQQSALTIFPNPVQQNLYVQLAVTKAEKLTLQVIDLQGKILQQQLVDVVIGNTSISINTGALAKGDYVLVVKGSVISQQKLFVKD